MGEGATPVLVACWKGQLEMVKYLVGEGADLEVGQRLSGETCLMGVSHYPDYDEKKHDVMRYLLEKGVDVDKRDLKGVN